MRRYGIFFVVGLLVLLALLLVESLGYPYRARVLPLMVIVLAMILLAGQLVRELFASRAKRVGNTPTREVEQVPGAKAGEFKFVSVLIWLAGLAAGIWLLGFVIGLPLFIFIYTKMHGERWLWAIVLSLVMLAVVSLGFGFLLKLSLYKGVLLG